MSGQRFCESCGTRLDPDARFCVSCGRPVGDAPPAGAVATPPPAASASTPPPAIAAASSPVGLFGRTLAFAIDVALIAAVLLVVRPSAGTAAAAAVLYFPILWALGGTAAMRVLGMRIADRDGHRASPVAAIPRLIGLAIATGPLLLGLVAIQLDRHGQGWHDRIARTFVVRGRGPVGPRTGGFLPGLAGLLGSLVLLVGTLAGAGAAYVNAPEIPPSALGVPSYDDVLIRVPLLQQVALSQPRRDEYATAVSQAVAQRARTAAAPTLATTAVAALRKAGVRVGSGDVVTTASGEKVLALGIDLASATSGGLIESYDAVLRLAGSKEIDLSTVHDVSVGILDSEGRLLVSVAAPSSAVQQFRAGAISRRDFLRTTAIRGESRAAVVDLVRQQIGGR